MTRLVVLDNEAVQALVLQSAPNADITVLTSDPGGIRRVAGDRPVTVVAI
jgi:hypothetical protein